MSERGIVWFCPNCRIVRYPIFNGGLTAGCIVCGAAMTGTVRPEVPR